MLVQLFRGSIVGAMLSSVGLATGCAEDPFDFGGPRSCETPDENVWVYGLMQDAYLWSPDMPDVDPTTFESPGEVVGGDGRFEGGVDEDLTVWFHLENGARAVADVEIALLVEAHAGGHAHAFHEDRHIA